MDQPQGKNEYIKHLAGELVDDIELSRLPGEALLLKVSRLARLMNYSEIMKWLDFEMCGYNDTDPISLKYLSLTSRWIDQRANKAYWGPLAQQDAVIATLQLRLQGLRVPDISNSVSSANPHQVVGSFVDPIATAIGTVLNESRAIGQVISAISGIKSRVLARLHNFVTNVYHECVFRGLAETIFERQQVQIDLLLMEHCGEVIKKIPSIYDRLAENDPESVSQALATCRRLIDSFADAIYPPSDQTIMIENNTVQLTAQHHQNRINAYIRAHVSSDSRRKKLRQSLNNLYARVSAGVHSDVTPAEGQSLFLETYLLLGEILNHG